jgi:hypothetical protein
MDVPTHKHAPVQSSRAKIHSLQMQVEQYVGLYPTWPAKGRHILAQFDQSSIYVYQAFRPSIASYAIRHQKFGGDFSYQRMSWIKPNFLWMMYRSGWASKPGQERILAVQLSRSFFDELLRSAVVSSHDPSRYRTQDEWKHAVETSDVRLQWDPDHDPAGRPLERRAIQLGLRGNALHRYGTTELVSITDITDFVIEQRDHLRDGFKRLLVPYEQVYRPEATAAKSAGI